MSPLDTNKVVIATKWSAITEIFAKIVSPITSMVLARLLTPEVFGVVATITMIVTFAEIFTDAGFQKYLIQHEFEDDIDREQSTTVAFWNNFILSIFLWSIIALFSEQLAVIVGNPGLGNVISIACISIPIASFSSIQMALYKRDLDFKTLFKVRLAGIIVPIVVTIPLALWLRSYWALVIGTIVTNLVNAIILTVYSKWKPRFYYSWIKFKEMFSFSSWSMIESVSIWLTGYIDIFIIGKYLSEYYLGIYKTSMTTVGQIITLITAATTPILFSSLSRLQNDRQEFESMFFKFQKTVGLLVIPLSIGIFCFRDLVTEILLGSQWGEASNFIGLWALTSGITIVLSHYSSEVYRSMGHPKLSVLAQVLHIIVLCPAMLIAVNYDWDVVYITRALVRLELVLVNLLLMQYVVKISSLKLIKNVVPSFLVSILMGCLATLLLNINSSIWLSLIYVFVCVIFYYIVVRMFKSERDIINSFYSKLLKNK